MVEQALLDWIEQERASGATDDVIKEILLNRGYTESQIDSAFMHLHANKARAMKPEQENETKLSPILIIAGLVLVVIVGTVIYFIVTDPTRDEFETHSEQSQTTNPAVNQQSPQLDEQDPDQQAINCGDCQYLREGVCHDYACCSDSDCDDSNAQTTDKCLNPNRLEAACRNSLNNACDRNSDCDDGKPETRDYCSGIPRTCTYTAIDACEGGDGYCYPGCTDVQDDDCQGMECSSYTQCPENNICVSGSCEPTDRETWCDIQGLFLCVDDDTCMGFDEYCDKCAAAEPAFCNIDNCQVDSDCDDGDSSTEDTCEGEPGLCINEIIAAGPVECGEFDQFTLSESGNPEQLPALVCMGEAFMNNCQEASAADTTHLDTYKDIKLSIFSEQDVCWFNWQWHDNIEYEEYANFSGLYYECPFTTFQDIEQVSAEAGPGELGANLFLLGAFMMRGPEPDCQGTFLDEHYYHTDEGWVYAANNGTWIFEIN